jgi:multiple sugar transport system ATP-binding protein
MRTEIKELHERLKTTTVYVTHDQIEAMTMADRIVIMRDGYIEQIGSPLEVYDHPANLFVAAFIGSPAMNLFEGVAGKSSVKLASGVELPLPRNHKASAGQPVVYGVRPEHLAIAKGVSARVNVTEPTGPEMHIYVDVGGKEVCAITQDRLKLARGDAIEIAPRLDRIHLFDQASGKALA